MSMNKEEVKITKLVIIGNSRDGKSSLGNFILKKNAFVVSDKLCPENKGVKGSYGGLDRNNVFVIDTPGVQESEEMNKKWINQMIDSIKKERELHGIIIVFNYNQDRFPKGSKEMIKRIYNGISKPEFWQHLCIILTNCYCYIPEKVIEKKISKKREEYQKEIMKLVIETTGNEESIEFPMYFVDSQPEEGEDNTRSEAEIKKFL
ncbi:hypothetical protein, conserved, partial [Entamoeba dispar SAW760]